MRHNDAHYNNSLVQICTQWNLDRNPFIYVSCLPEGTKLHCVAAVLPLLLLQRWHFGWKQLLSEPPATALLNCPVTAFWQALGGTWLPPHDSYVNGMLCGCLSKLLVGSWDAVPHCNVRSSPAVWGEHTCMSSYLSDLGRVSRESKFCNLLCFVVWSKEEGHSEVRF